MRIIVIKDNIKVEYEEPQKENDYPRLVNGEESHKRILEAIELICQQVIALSK